MARPTSAQLWKATLALRAADGVANGALGHGGPKTSVKRKPTSIPRFRYTLGACSCWRLAGGALLDSLMPFLSRVANCEAATGRLNRDLYSALAQPSEVIDRFHEDCNRLKTLRLGQVKVGVEITAFCNVSLFV